MGFALPNSTYAAQGHLTPRMGTDNTTPGMNWVERESIRYTPWHLSQDSYYEVQRTNNFMLVIGPPAYANDFNGGNNGAQDTLGDEFTLCVDSCPLPTIETNPIELSYMNSKVKVAGDASFGDLSVAVKDVIDNDMEMRLWYWRRQVFNPQTGKVGWARAYKRNGVIHQYGPNGECDRTWELVGIWPTSIELGELSYESADKKQLTMNLSVDFAYPGAREVRVGRYGTSDDGTVAGTEHKNNFYYSATGNTGTVYTGNMGHSSIMRSSQQDVSWSNVNTGNTGSTART